MGVLQISSAQMQQLHDLVLTGSDGDGDGHYKVMVHRFIHCGCICTEFSMHFPSRQKACFEGAKLLQNTQPLYHFSPYSILEVHITGPEQEGAVSLETVSKP